MDKKIVNLATELHSHLAPGIALGLRMSEIALSRMNAKKGDKYLIGISETTRCLADAMQAATGCTLGHGSAFEEEEELGLQLLDMDEKYFFIQHVEINRDQNFEKAGIVTCSNCGELIPQVLTASKNNLVYCNACCGKAYYKIA